MRTLWAWHCVEENEHKAVAFDTYETLYDKSVVDYAIRMGTMALITALIMVAIHSFIVELMREDKQLLNLRSWAKGLNRVWGPKGSG